ncbi:MAG: LPP20 family lipoprotein [Bacteroidales bacterium]|nr:LPP20 family lipoprotein [Bacteroidales bacterium]
MKRTILYFFLLILISCSSTKNLTYEELMAGAPTWVKQTPNSSDYYHGVGMASKVTAPVDFREVARQNALSELASGISVNISSTSVLNQFEFDDNYSEYFRDNIKLTTQQYLEGYELVDNWENAQQYWVYYRLSKSKFKEIKQQRINKAIEASKAEFMKAKEFKTEGNFQESMQFYIKSLDDVKDFLGDDLKTEIEGKNEDYSSLLISEMIRMIPRLSIETSDKFQFIRGVGHMNENITLMVLYDHQFPVKGVNVELEFSYAPGKSIMNISDAEGKIRVKNENFDTRKKEEYLRATVNIEKLIKESTSDQMVRRLMESMEFPVYVFPIEIISPKFHIMVGEKNLGNDLKNGITIKAFRNLIEKDGFEIVGEGKIADYTLISEVSTQKGNEVNGKFTTRLNATFALKNGSGHVVYAKELSDISGVGSSYESAGEDAYRSLEGKIRINIYPAMYKAVFGSF